MEIDTFAIHGFFGLKELYILLFDSFILLVKMIEAGNFIVLASNGLALKLAFAV